MMRKMSSLLWLFSVAVISCQKPVGDDEKSTPVNDDSNAERKIIDLTYELSDETVFWVTSKEFELEEVAKGMTEKGFYYSANNFCMAEHGGTHIDAPIHFAEGGQSVDEVPLEKLIGDGIKIDVSKNALPDPDYLVSVEDLQRWENENGEIPAGSIVLLQTGYGSYYPDKIKYLGTEDRGVEAIKELHFPGLSPEAAQWLVDNRDIKSIGIDTPSIDYGQSQDFKSHVILLSENIPGFENVANMDQLPVNGFQVIALPIKIKGGSGGPLRIIAFVDN